jgi:hypothetical protein
MGRAVEIVVVDGKRRFGNGFFLPTCITFNRKFILKDVAFFLKAFLLTICFFTTILITYIKGGTPAQIFL